MRRTSPSRATIALSAAVALLGTSFVSTGVAFADEVKNQTVADGSSVITAGGSTTVTYKLDQTSAAAEGAGGLNNCNASATSPVVIGVTVPAGVTANRSALTFTGCTGNDTVQVTYTGVTAGSYPIRHAEISGPGINTGSTADFTLTVNPAAVVTPPPPPADVTPPALTLPSIITAEATSAAGAVVTYAASATDAKDGSVDASCTPASGGTFALGTTTVNCSARDAANNPSTGSFTVTVADTTKPELSAAADVTKEATSAAGVVVTYTAPTATDAVDPSPVVTCSPASGSTFAVGNTTVSCTATDAAGNTSAARTFVVTGADTTAPELAAQDDMTAEATSAAGAVVSFSSPAATDAVDANPAVTCLPASGSTLKLGDTLVSCTAQDAAGNSSDATTFTVSVTDTIAPELADGADVIAEATSAAGAVVTYTNPAATDAVDATPTVTCLPASGSTFKLGEATVSCAAEDAAGNISDATTFAVTVADTTAPKLTAKGDVTAEATSAAGADVDYTAPTATDAVDANPTVSCLPASGSTFALGKTTVSCTATDAADNTSEATTFTVTVADTTAPANITFGSTGIQAGGSYLPSGVPAAPTCTATDVVTATPTCVVTGRSTGFGSQTLTATAKDTAGNSSTATLTYTVRSATLSGFRAPVDLGGVLNTVKGGSTVPLKFTVMDGTTVITSTAGLTFTAVKVSCATGAVGEDAIEELASTGGTTLRYDTTGQQFIQNWKTPTTPGVCYLVTVSSADVKTSSTALFKIK